MGIAFLFPGQGSQHVGMGQELHRAYPYVRELFAMADDALGYSLSRLCFEGPQADLVRTENTQPAILTVSCAAALALRRELGLRPSLCAGHSLGEYSALVCAGSISFQDAVTLCHLRGRLMQEAVPEGQGAMAAIVGLEADEVAALCREAGEGGELSEPANDNGAGQIVISGHRGAVERAMTLARARGARLCKLLQVSAPFHCQLMEPARERLVPRLAATALRAPSCVVVANVDAQPYPEGATAQAIADRLARQVTGTVLWDASMKRLVELGMTCAVEVGPGRVLQGLLKRIAPSVEIHAFCEPEQLDALRAMTSRDHGGPT